ncbi:2-isopropylmalate synthase [Gaopeijia maritima]|uniref:2-isopropylmalate synthase n=1 Tax=Gaopeijia maritima TaxID=3119007 RepID=A0ABU9E4M4_9BACT
MFDTTLRDGEQSPGSSMTGPEKLRVARALDEMGVNVIEAGFPVASPEEFEAVVAVAGSVEKATVAALARASRHDVERAAEALTDARRPRIHTFLPTSDLHLEHKLGIGRDEALRRIGDAVEHARRHVDDVEFSAEDATRTDPTFLVQAVAVAVQAGATTVNLPDTVGFAHADDVARMFDAVRSGVPGIEGVVLSFHGHDDLGLATANSLTALDHGARQVECTLNGIGERAGNAALEEVVMALRVLPRYRERYATGVRAERLGPASRLLARITGIRPQPNKAVVGANAFAHEAGIHQHGVLADPRTYEIMTPGDVGAPESVLVLGKHSGRHALVRRYEDLGFTLTPEEASRAYRLFVMLADRKRDIHDEDLLAIYYGGTMERVPQAFRLEYLDVRCGRSPSRAEVRVAGDGGAAEAEGLGDGPIDATFAALTELAPWEVRLEDFAIRAVGEGSDAVGEVHLELRVEGRSFTGRSVSTDIVDAAARAYLYALDKASHAEALEARSFERHPMWGV